MTDFAQSYLKVQYDLRPAKQVERRMMIDVFVSLMTSGFAIQEYQYTGFGSIYFVDFILLHRYLGMSRLLSVEHDLSIEKRVDFNSPFSSVETRMASISDVIPELDPDLRHILWLDFDSQVNRKLLRDVVLAAYQLSVGSILLVTVDVEPPRDGKGPAEWIHYFEQHADEYLEFEWTSSDFSRSKLPATNSRIVLNAISRGLSGRPNVEFQSLFKFVYADGHEMVTIGGMIATDNERRLIQASGLESKAFVRLNPDRDPYRIMVPRLTRKERLYLDHFMPCSDDWLPGEFEMDPDDVLSYRDIYRYYPMYAELLL